MNVMPTKSTVVTAVWTLAALAALYRAGMGDVITGRKKLFGLF